MGTEAKAPVGSRWKLKNDPKNRVWVITERLPFGRLYFQQEDKAVTGDTTLKHLLVQFDRLPALTKGI